MRNIQKNLIPKWKPSNKISDLIEELPNFCNNLEYQIGKGLLPNIGEYSIRGYKYDINDFFRNQNNKCFKIVVPSKEENDEKTIFHNRYFVVTSTFFVILEPVDEKYKNICVIDYVGDLFEIEKIERFLKSEEEYKDYSCFKIKWSKNYNNQLDCTMCGDSRKLVVANLSECLLKRKGIIINNFKFVQKSESASVKIYEEIIKIKEKLVESQTNEAVYIEINALYQKIIEVLSSLNGDDFKKYLDKLHKFIDAYDKLKAEEAKKNKLLKEKENNNNKNGANTK